MRGGELLAKNANNGSGAGKSLRRALKNVLKFIIDKNIFGKFKFLY